MSKHSVSLQLVQPLTWFSPMPSPPLSLSAVRIEPARCGASATMSSSPFRMEATIRRASMLRCITILPASGGRGGRRSDSTAKNLSEEEQEQEQEEEQEQEQEHE